MYTKLEYVSRGHRAIIYLYALYRENGKKKALKKERWGEGGGGGQPGFAVRRTGRSDRKLSHALNQDRIGEV